MILKKKQRRKIKKEQLKGGSEISEDSVSKQNGSSVSNGNAENGKQASLSNGKVLDVPKKLDKQEKSRSKKIRSSSYQIDKETGPFMYRYLSLQNYMKETEELSFEPSQSQDVDDQKENELTEQNIETHKFPPPLDKGSKRGPKLDDNFRVKIVDLGNACWTHHHFSPEIQTRQYRSPEVIIGVSYGPSADIWSLACTVFEMLTGDFLFEPKKGPNFGKDDDHLALMIELLGKIPKKLALSGINTKEYFDRTGNLKKIKGFHYWPLKGVLGEKYHLKENEAQGLTDFLVPMLEYYPYKRGTAQQCLRHYWLKMPPTSQYKYTEEEIKQRSKYKKNANEHSNYSIEEPESELGDADSEDNPDISDDDSELSFDQHDNYGYGNLLNKSFGKTGYVPYGGGLKASELDQDPNWQFLDVDKL